MHPQKQSSSSPNGGISASPRPPLRHPHSSSSSSSPVVDITSLPNEVVRYIVKEFLTAADEDSFGLVCRHWRHLRDDDLWKGHRLGDTYDRSLLSPLVPHPVERLSKRPFRFFGVRTTGTEGMCCKVHFRGDGRLYAMKKARVYPKGEGVPYYMLREIEFLRCARHPHISSLCAVSLRGSELLMFFPYCPRTLHEALNPPNERNESGMPLPLHVTKRFLYQILLGLSFCHDRGVLHRNLKPKHLLLLSSPDESASALSPRDQHWERDVKDHETIPVRDLERCNVLISDFALVRTSLLPLRRFTPEVVTLWYRAPEILLGGPYFTSVDVWSVGCVFAEMLTGRPFFAGVCEVNQLFEIFSRVGSPTEATWPGFAQLPNISLDFPNWPQVGLKRFFPQLPADGLALLESMLQLNPAHRVHARDALLHPFFAEFHHQPAQAAAAPTTTTLPPPPGLANPVLLNQYLPNMVQIECEAASGLLCVQHEPTKSLRARACQRIIEINDMFEMSTRTEFLAVNLLDRYLHKVYNNSNHTNADTPPPAWPALLDITCLHMASKCEDVSYIGVGDLIGLPAPLENEPTVAPAAPAAAADAAAASSSRDKLSDMLLDLQERVLGELDFRLQIPTVLDFLACFCFKLGLATTTPTPGDTTLHFDAMCYFAELSLLHPGLVQYRASVLALSIACFAYFALRQKPNDDEMVPRAVFEELFRLVGADVDELVRCVLLVKECTVIELDTMHHVLNKRYRTTGKVQANVMHPTSSSFDVLHRQLDQYRDWVVAS